MQYPDFVRVDLIEDIILDQNTFRLIIYKYVRINSS